MLSDDKVIIKTNILENKYQIPFLTYHINQLTKNERRYVRIFDEVLILQRNRNLI